MREVVAWWCPQCGEHVSTAVPVIDAPRHNCCKRAGRTAVDTWGAAAIRAAQRLVEAGLLVKDDD
jgi:hypothetical protein